MMSVSACVGRQEFGGLSMQVTEPALRLERSVRSAFPFPVLCSVFVVLSGPVVS
jgi:hypothetical protein